MSNVTNETFSPATRTPSVDGTTYDANGFLCDRFGHIFTVDDWRRAREFCKRTPVDVSDVQIAIIQSFEGDQHAVIAEDVRRQARRRLSAELASNADDVPTSAPASACVQPLRKGAAPATTVPRDWDEMVAHDPYAFVPIAVFDTLFKMVIHLNAKKLELESRLKALESRPVLKYGGVWRTEAKYAEGALTTHDGSLWLAVGPLTDRPGTSASGWQLIVKRGQV